MQHDVWELNSGRIKGVTFSQRGGVKFTFGRLRHIFGVETATVTFIPSHVSSIIDKTAAEF